MLLNLEFAKILKHRAECLLSQFCPMFSKIYFNK